MAHPSVYKANLFDFFIFSLRLAIVLLHQVRPAIIIEPVPCAQKGQFRSPVGGLSS